MKLSAESQTRKIRKTKLRKTSTLFKCPTRRALSRRNVVFIGMMTAMTAIITNSTPHRHAIKRARKMRFFKSIKSDADDETRLSRPCLVPLNRVEVLTDCAREKGSPSPSVRSHSQNAPPNQRSAVQRRRRRETGCFVVLLTAGKVDIYARCLK